jgi:hypothetical protein
MMQRLLAGVLVLLLAAPVVAEEFAGVTLPDTADVAGQTLKLNGAGLRTRFFFNVYVIGLYHVRPARTPREALDADGPKRIVLHLLRALDGPEIAQAIADGFARNSAATMPQLRERLTRFEGMFPSVKAGETIELTVAGGKTTVVVQGTERGSIDGADFGRALLAVWLGPDPVDAELRTQLLGD